MGEIQQRNPQFGIIQVRFPTWKFATMLTPSAANTPITKATLFVFGNLVAASCDDQKVSSCLYLTHTVIKTEMTNIVHGIILCSIHFKIIITFK